MSARWSLARFCQTFSRSRCHFFHNLGELTWRLSLAGIVEAHFCARKMFCTNERDSVAVWAPLHHHTISSATVVGGANCVCWKWSADSTVFWRCFHWQIYDSALCVQRLICSWPSYFISQQTNFCWTMRVNNMVFLIYNYYFMGSEVCLFPALRLAGAKQHNTSQSTRLTLAGQDQVRIHWRHRFLAAIRCLVVHSGLFTNACMCVGEWVEGWGWLVDCVLPYLKNLNCKFWV